MAQQELPTTQTKPIARDPASRKSGMRRVLVGLAALVTTLLVLVGVAAFVVAKFDWNRARPWVAARLAAATGRDVSLDGDLRVTWNRHTSGRHASWFPRATVSAGHVRIGNPAWAAQKTFASFDAIEFDLLPLALLEHRLSLQSIHVVAPVVDLERRADGSGNWAFAGGRPSGWRVDVGRVTFDSGHLTIDDAQRKLHAQIRIDPLDKPIDFDGLMHAQEQRLGQIAGDANEAKRSSTAPVTRSQQQFVFAWTAQGRLGGAALAGDGRIGGVLGLSEPEEPWPVQGEISVAQTRVNLIGTLTNPADISALDLRLWLSGASMADLYPLFGLTLPETPPFATDGHLWAQLQESGNVFRYIDFHGRVGHSDLSGDLLYDGRPQRPLLSGSVSSNLLQFSDLGPLIGAGEPGKSAAVPEAGKTLPVRRFRVERWQSTDAAVQFQAKRIVGESALPIQDITTHIAMNAGVLTLKPLRFAIAGGDADANLRLDGNKSPPQGTLDAHAHGIKFSALVPAAAAMRSASVGEIEGDAALAISGASVAELSAGANGEIKLLATEGNVSKALLERAGLNVANIILTRMFGDEQVQIRCAASDFLVQKGVLKSRLFVFDTDLAQIDIDGSIDLGQETLDLTIHPSNKRLRVFSLRAPLHVTGTFKHVDIAVDKGTLIARGGGAAALSAVAPVAALIPLTAPSRNNENRCPAVLAQIRTAPKR